MTKAAATPIWTRPRVEAMASLLVGQAPRASALSGATAEPEQPEGTTGELWLYGVVGGWWRGFDAESVSNALRSLDVDTLYVRIHSPGGHASDGVAIANLLRNHRSRVVVVVDGLAASAASVIAIAGDEIVMCPGSQLMLHDASTGGWGNAAELRSAAEWIDKQSQNYAGIYAFRAGGTPEQWRAVMLADDGRGTWYTAEESVTAKLADRVGTVVAVGSPPVSPEDEIDWDDDMLARAAHDLALLEHHVHPAARAAWTGEQPTKPPSASAVGSTTPQEESAVAFSDVQMKTMRAKLGLSEDADEATIVAALSESLEERAEPTTQVPEGMALVETAVLEQLRTGAEAGRSAREELNIQARDRVIDAAIAKGKTTPARREHWEASWKGDPEGTKSLLEALEPGLAVPVQEIGHAEDTDVSAALSLDEVRNDPSYNDWKVN